VLEICGNCIDDDNNGLTDFEDPACCPARQSFAMSVTRGLLRPGGTTTRLRLKSLLATSGLENVDPLREDVFLQIRAEKGPELLCAKVPADKIMRMHGAFKFWDRKHLVASAKGLDDLSLKVRRNRSVRLSTVGKRVQMQPPSAGALKVTVGFHHPVTDAENSCSTTVQPFRSGQRGGLVTP
jgi:hypothetical protein